MAQRCRLQLLIHRWNQAIDDQDRLVAHQADEYIAWSMRAIPHASRDATTTAQSQDLNE
jgi:hypothetical protein